MVAWLDGQPHPPPEVTQRIPMPQPARSQPNQMVLDAPLTDMQEAKQERSPRRAQQPSDYSPQQSRETDAQEISAKQDQPEVEKEFPESTGNVQGSHRSAVNDPASNTSTASTSTASASVASPMENPEAFVTATAEEMMRDVFDDVDRMLDNGVVIPPEAPSKSDSSKSTFSAVPQPPKGELTALDTPPDENLDKPNASSNPAPERTVPRLGVILVRLSLIVSASIGLGVGLAWWMAQRNQSELVTTSPEAVSSAETTAVNGGDGDSFGNYILESLETIDRRYELLARSGEGQAVSDEDSGAIASAETPDSNLPAVERVYIPVYQPPQNSNSLPSLAPVPFGQLSAAAPSPAPQPSENADPDPVPNIAADTTHTLVGTLELGDRSAAIFEYAGSAHRVEVGEQIGFSGWSLVSVTGNEVRIRRNGEVRSVFVQQSFGGF